MDYYEELGVTPAATEEEIRRSHRRLAKLFHPDQQTDEALKQLAEIQMRRLNSIVATLTNPEQRARYDEQLRGGLPLLSLARTKRAAKQSWLWWLGSVAAAIALTLTAARLWPSGRATPTEISASSVEVASEPKVSAGRQDLVSAARSVQGVEAPLEGSRTVARIVAAPSARKKLSLPASMMVARVTIPARKVDLPPPPKLGSTPPVQGETAPLENAGLPVAPKPTPEPVGTIITHASTRPRDPLEGEWVYAPTTPEKKKSGFYPPEFIDMKLFWSEGGLRGEYRARYVVDENKPIVPEVNFTLAPDRNPRHFLWQSSSGSQGSLRIKSIDPGGQAIRIEWDTTKYSPGLNLTAGTAILVRRPATR